MVKALKSQLVIVEQFGILTVAGRILLPQKNGGSFGDNHSQQIVEPDTSTCRLTFAVYWVRFPGIRVARTTLPFSTKASRCGSITAKAPGCGLRFPLRGPVLGNVVGRSESVPVTIAMVMMTPRHTILLALERPPGSNHGKMSCHTTR